MIKKVIFYTSFFALVMIFGSGFKRYEFKHIPGFHLEQDTIYYATVSNFVALENKAINYIETPKSIQSFIQFRDKLAFKESQGRYNVINRFGYMGKYQFGKNTLRVLGVTDTESYIHNPKLQEKSFEALLSINKYILRDYIKKYNKKIIGGVKITESGILAAAHLGGAGSVSKFLKSNGSIEFKDGNGLSIKAYLKAFGNYNTSHILAKRSVNLSHFETKKSNENISLKNELISEKKIEKTDEKTNQQKEIINP